MKSQIEYIHKLILQNVKQRRENRNLQKQQIIFQLKPLVSFSIRNFFHDHQWIFYQTKKLYSTNEKKNSMHEIILKKKKTDNDD